MAALLVLLTWSLGISQQLVLRANCFRKPLNLNRLFEVFAFRFFEVHTIGAKCSTVS